MVMICISPCTTDVRGPAPGWPGAGPRSQRAAWAALRIRSVTGPGWETIAAWDESIWTVRACIRVAMKRSAAGGGRVVLAGDQVPGREGRPGRDAGGRADGGQRSRPLGRGHGGGGGVGAVGAE